MQSLVRGEWRHDGEMMGEIGALGSTLPEAGVRSSPCSRSVRDRPRMLPARRVGFRLAFWCRRTTVASRLSDRDSDRCEYQSANAGGGTHPCIMLDVPRELGCLPLRFDHIRSISESVRPQRVVRIASSGPIRLESWSRPSDGARRAASRWGTSIVQVRAESIMVNASSCSYTGQPEPAVDCAGQTGC